MKNSNVLFTITAIDGIALPENTTVKIVRNLEDTLSTTINKKTGVPRRRRLYFTPEQWAQRVNTKVSTDNYGWGYDEINNGIPFAWFGVDNEGRTSAILAGADVEMLRNFYKNRK